MLDSTSRLFATNPIAAARTITDRSWDANGRRAGGGRQTRPCGLRGALPAVLRPCLSLSANPPPVGGRRRRSDATGFLKALDALPRYRTHGAPFAAWLFTIARHTLADRFRRHPATLPLEAASELLAEHEMEAVVLRHESFEQLAMLLDGLNPDARDLLALRFAAGLTTPEIAAILDKRPTAVRKSLSRLLQTLKGQYHASH